MFLIQNIKFEKYKPYLIQEKPRKSRFPSPHTLRKFALYLEIYYESKVRGETYLKRTLDATIADYMIHTSFFAQGTLKNLHKS